MGKPFFKEVGPSATVQRRMRKAAGKAAEDVEKSKVRRRDKGCRFPLCGCRRMGLASLEVSHSRHKGAGGNPDGQRSLAPLMLLACRERHQLNAFAIDRGTVRWEPMTSLGANGPIRWTIDVHTWNHRVHGRELRAETKMFEVARETSLGVLAALLPGQRAILAQLAEMML